MLYLTVDTNPNDNVRISTYQYGDRVFTNDAFIHSGSNKVALISFYISTRGQSML